MKNYFRAINSVKFSEWTLLFQVFLNLCWLKLNLLMLPWSSFREKYTQALKSNTQNKTLSLETRNSVIRYIKAISHYLPFGFTCLPQALCLKYFLKSDPGVKVILGVNNDAGFQAHAWVEKEGLYLIGDQPLIQYKTIWTWA
jgi:hypothetical protein